MTLTSPPPPAPVPVAPAFPWRALLRAALWLLAAQLAVMLAAGAAGFIAGLTQVIARQHGGIGWQPTPVVYSLVGVVALQAILLLGAVKQGRSLGGGSVSAGLGAGPVRRKRLVAIFAALQIAWVLVFIAIVIYFVAIRGAVVHDLPPALALPLNAGAILLFVRMLIVALLAPLAEELFFRGWLWMALRRSWSVLVTAIVTGGLRLSLHAIDGPARALVLLPGAILLSLARHHGGSVRASLVVHIANNSATTLLQLVALALAGR